MPVTSADIKRLADVLTEKKKAAALAEQRLNDQIVRNQRAELELRHAQNELEVEELNQLLGLE